MNISTEVIYKLTGVYEKDNGMTKKRYFDEIGNELRLLSYVVKGESLIFGYTDEDNVVITTKVDSYLNINDELIVNTKNTTYVFKEVI